MIQTGAFSFLDGRRQTASQRLQYMGRMDDVLGLADVDHMNGWLGWRSPRDPEAPHRPFLHFDGMLSRVQCQTPAGPADLTLDAANVPVSYTYDFTDAELETLVHKGLFRAGFKVPDELYNVRLETIPMRVNVEQYMSEEGVPLTFVEPVNPYDNVIDAQSSGYTMARFFDTAPDYTTIPQREPLKDNEAAAQLQTQSEKTLQAAPETQAQSEAQEQAQPEATHDAEPDFSFSQPTFEQSLTSEQSMDDAFAAIDRTMKRSLAARDQERASAKGQAERTVEAAAPASSSEVVAEQHADETLDDGLDGIDDIDLPLDDIDGVYDEPASDEPASDEPASDEPVDTQDVDAEPGDEAHSESEQDSEPSDDPADILARGATSVEDGGVEDDAPGLDDDGLSDLDDLANLYATSDEPEEGTSSKKPHLTATQREQIIQNDRNDDKLADSVKRKLDKAAAHTQAQPDQDVLAF